MHLRMYVYVCLCERGVEEIYLNADFLRNFFKYTFNYALGILKFDSILFDNVLVTKVYWNEWYPIPKYREMSILKVDQVLQTGLQVVTLCNQGNDIK